MIGELSERVRDAAEAAKARGYSVAQIALACGISKQAVYQWLDGSTKSIDGANLAELASMSALEPMWIAKGKGRKTSALTDDERTILDAYRLFDDGLRRSWLLTAADAIKAAKESAA
jgi:transcriptional regulator with XRE-family HTH domain